jgi:hypothetical protein
MEFSPSRETTSFSALSSLQIKLSNSSRIATRNLEMNIEYVPRPSRYNEQCCLDGVTLAEANYAVAIH